MEHRNLMLSAYCTEAYLLTGTHADRGTTNTYGKLNFVQIVATKYHLGKRF